jgi:hypothetical protein
MFEKKEFPILEFVCNSKAKINTKQIIKRSQTCL